MFDNLGMCRVDSTHGAHATDIYLYMLKQIKISAVKYKQLLRAPLLLLNLMWPPLVKRFPTTALGDLGNCQLGSKINRARK